MSELTVQEFANDDASYLRWLARHPSGFVINTPRSKPSNYMVIHRASCPTISNYTKMAQPGGFTERDYIKICSANIPALRAWVKEHGRSDGSFSGTCGRCNPM